MRTGGVCFSMVRICTGEVCVRSSRRSRVGLRSWSGDEQRVLRVARRMVRRKVQRLEVVVVGLDLGAFADRVAHRLEDGDDLVLHAQHRMLDADRALNAGQRDVEALGGELGIGRRGVNACLCASSMAASARAFSSLTRCPTSRFASFGRGLQPGVVDLREHAVLARHPAIAERLPVGFAVAARQSRRRARRTGRRRRDRARQASSRRVWERCT